MRPTREHATNNRQTYMITTETWQRRALFRNERWAKLLIDTIYHYRGSTYLLHEFVIMPDHIHVLITPATSLEKAVQFIKGGFRIGQRRNWDRTWRYGRRVSKIIASAMQRTTTPMSHTFVRIL